MISLQNQMEMKQVFTVTLFLICLTSFAQNDHSHPNIFIITLDGYRWQEVFNGADPSLLSDKKYVADTATAIARWGDSSIDLRRKRLMPFFWNVIANKGSLYGNRNYDNKVDVSNRYKISYPGYNEIFTGYPDPEFIPNLPKYNHNENIFEALNNTETYKNQVAAFCSWNILPYILNKEQCSFPVNAGYENINNEEDSTETSVINALQDNVEVKEHTRYDEFTFMYAKEYLKKHHPKVMLIGFGETDEFAHARRYDMYLQQANKIDNMIGELWYEVQQNPYYKNNTIFIITTDHGRGKKHNRWPYHFSVIKGSGEAWMAFMGTPLVAEGEVKVSGQLYQKQIASTIAYLADQTFNPKHKPGEKIALKKIYSQKENQVQTFKYLDTKVIAAN